MTNLDSQIEELIKERNAFETENIALKAQVNAMNNFLIKTATPVFILAAHDYPASHGPRGNLNELESLISKTPEQCLNSVKVAAYEDGFRYSCAVYNGGSSEQVIEVAVDSYKDELEAHNDKPQA